MFHEIELIAFDFDGVFTDNSVLVSETGEESVRCNRSDGLGLSRLKKMGIKLIIVSTEKNPVVSKRALKLDLPCRQNVEDKAKEIIEICNEFNVSPSKTMFVGNDINDIPAFLEVGCPVAVNDAYPEVLAYVKYRTQRNGGYGAVREICDLVYFSKIGKEFDSRR